jgi:hypothetical protein
MIPMEQMMSSGVCTATRVLGSNMGGKQAVRKTNERMDFRWRLRDRLKTSQDLAASRYFISCCRIDPAAYAE